jgi:signal transduction histidine kinase
VDADTILQESLRKTKEVTRRHIVALKCRADPGVMGISFDPLWLEQIIINLVINAVEASPEGSTVSVILSRSPTTGLILDVTDHGYGIT